MLHLICVIYDYTFIIQLTILYWSCKTTQDKKCCKLKISQLREWEYWEDGKWQYCDYLIMPFDPNSPMMASLSMGHMIDFAIIRFYNHHHLHATFSFIEKLEVVNYQILKLSQFSPVNFVVVVMVCIGVGWGWYCLCECVFDCVSDNSVEKQKTWRSWKQNWDCCNQRW